MPFSLLTSLSRCDQVNIEACWTAASPQPPRCAWPGPSSISGERPEKAKQALQMYATAGQIHSFNAEPYVSFFYKLPSISKGMGEIGISFDSVLSFLNCLE
jgi:hypothetical protein